MPRLSSTDSAVSTMQVSARGNSAIAPLLPRRGVMRALGIASLLAVCALWSGCAAFMMSPESEVEYGKQVQFEIEKQAVMVNDPLIVNYVRTVGARVLANAPQKAAVPTQFHVIKNDEINAFAIPGGNIYVHTGLLNAANDEAELASVLSHEYGHVVFRHGAQHQSRAAGFGVVEQLVLGENSGSAAKLAADLLGQVGLQKFSRQDELEADSVAVPTLYAANYDPQAMVTFFQTLKQKYGDSSGAVTFLNSHPATGERIDRVQKQIATMPPKENLVRPVNDLRKVQGRLQDLGLVKR